MVADTKKITPSELTKVAAALQKQATRDFGHIWEIQASVSAFAKLEDVPTDYWPIIVRDDINTPGAAGVHEDKNGQPFALVQFSNDWPLTASHETLEMLGDPFGNRLVAGKSPKQGQGRVNFLVEVCDPSEDRQFAYTVNGITVSDFYTPHFFDPVAAPSVRYSYTGAITKPRTILQGGYLSWVVAQTNEWFQMVWFDTSKPVFRSLGVLSGKITGSLRATIDRLTPTPLETTKLAAKSQLVAAARDASEEVDDSSTARAEFLRKHIEEIKKAK
ncbi:MAG TPA: hypothetical protein VN904_06105 [Chthoniobacterales bacterium]|nr:hypothetical protein [Chthoniobacterales bacterium]